MKKILIANRGEIAVRIIRACNELGIPCVAIHSTADKESLHAKLADESVCIGPGPSLQSYLSIPKIISAAEVTGADAIHPGYGFLSENAEFAKVCTQHNINFIGPKAEHIERLGDKVEARALAIATGVPLLPGSDGEVKSVDEAKKVVKEIGLPVIIKAAAGGGGRGMKIVRSLDELEKQFELARNEAQTGFNNPSVFIEKYLQSPRHVEIQLAGDSHGNVLHFGERDCSLQRRHQKIVEEAPCPILSEAQRQKMGQTAINLLRHVGYTSLATAEFLMEPSGDFYFMEVNTRVQVEHPVTEIVTDTDLIKLQISIAKGEEIPFKQSDIKVKGHAMECRINAEDPVSFAPWPGKITDFHAPGGPGVRVDSMIYSGYTVPPLYDSMIAKIISFGKDRAECIVRMRRALRETKIDGIRTNIDFHLKILADPKFQNADISTHYLEEFVKNAKNK